MLGQSFLTMNNWLYISLSQARLWNRKATTITEGTIIQI